MEVKQFGATNYLFVLSERGSAIGVYRDTGSAPEFVQLLPTAIGPEGAVAIPGRNLLAVSNETDLIEDGGVRSHVTLYSYGEGPAQYPMVVSGSDHSRSEEHTSELQSLMRNSYAVFCLKKKNKHTKTEAIQ